MRRLICIICIVASPIVAASECLASAYFEKVVLAFADAFAQHTLQRARVTGQWDRAVLAPSEQFRSSDVLARERELEQLQDSPYPVFQEFLTELQFTHAMGARLSEFLVLPDAEPGLVRNWAWKDTRWFRGRSKNVEAREYANHLFLARLQALGFHVPEAANVKTQEWLDELNDRVRTAAGLSSIDVNTDTLEKSFAENLLTRPEATAQESEFNALFRILKPTIFDWFRSEFGELSLVDFRIRSRVDIRPRKGIDQEFVVSIHLERTGLHPGRAAPASNTNDLELLFAVKPPKTCSSLASCWHDEANLGELRDQLRFALAERAKEAREIFSGNWPWPACGLLGIMSNVVAK